MRGRRPSLQMSAMPPIHRRFIADLPPFSSLHHPISAARYREALAGATAAEGDEVQTATGDEV